ncbi:MAG: DUF4339 domain-containing protein [Thermoguttaceae bacterium]|nr:DUF4339 domain-containing protein [Thermoguttaceae bacterium]
MLPEISRFQAAFLRIPLTILVFNLVFNIMTNSSSSESWYYYINNQKLGPVSGQDIKRLASTGEITPQTIIEHNGKQGRAENVKGLTFIPTPVVISSQSSGVFQAPSVPDFSTVGDSSTPDITSNPDSEVFQPQPVPDFSSVGDSNEKTRKPKNRHRSDDEITYHVSPLGIASLVLGIWACILASIPLIAVMAWSTAIIGIVIAAIAFGVQKLEPHKTSMSFPIAGVILCIIAVIFAFLMILWTEKNAINKIPRFLDLDSSISNPDNFTLTHYPTPIRKDR